MNTNEIIERLWADPEDNVADLVAALAANPELLAEQQAARNFNARLKLGMHSVHADAALHLKLLQIADQDDNLADADVSLVPPAITASNDSIWRRALPVAACLMLVLSLVLYYRPDLNVELEHEIFAHVYGEQRFLDNKADISLSEVNTKMDDVLGTHLQNSAAIKNLAVRFADDCWIANAKALHLIVKGETGPVTLIMIPGSVAASEFKIADERFRGIVTPTSGGTLVILGNQQEPIEDYRRLMATNLDWEY
jgi:hypothetical protein